MSILYATDAIGQTLDAKAATAAGTIWMPNQLAERQKAHISLAACVVKEPFVQAQTGVPLPGHGIVMRERYKGMAILAGAVKVCLGQGKMAIHIARFQKPAIFRVHGCLDDPGGMAIGVGWQASRPGFA